MAAAIYLYVADVDETYKRAISLGEKSVREQSRSDLGRPRWGVKDTSGNIWWIATNKGAK